MPHTALYLLFSERLGEDVGQVIRAAREAGESWSNLEFRLRSETGLSVTYETLRVWHVTLSEGN